MALRPPVSISRHLRVDGLDRVIINSGLQNEDGNDLIKAWGKRLSRQAVLLNVETLIKAVIDNFALINKPDQLLGAVGERIPWTADVSNDAIFALLNTMQGARRKYNADNGVITTTVFRSVVVVTQRLIDLTDGNIDRDSYDDSWMKHQQPSRKDQEVLARELIRMKQDQHTEYEQSQYDMDGDDLEENADYPVDNEEVVVIVDPELEDSDPRTGIPLPPDDPAPNTKPDRAVPSKAPELKTANKASKVSSGIGKSSGRVEKRTAAPRKAAAPRKTAVPDENIQGHTNLFQEFYKGVPTPYILPVDNTPTNFRIMKLPIRLKPQPESAPLPQPRQPAAVDNETRRVVPRMSRPKPSIFMIPRQVRRALDRAKNPKKEDVEGAKMPKKEDVEDEEDEDLFVK